MINSSLFIFLVCISTVWVNKYRFWYVTDLFFSLKFNLARTKIPLSKPVTNTVFYTLQNGLKTCFFLGQRSQSEKKSIIFCWYYIRQPYFHCVNNNGTGNCSFRLYLENIIYLLSVTIPWITITYFGKLVLWVKAFK